MSKLPWHKRNWRVFWRNNKEWVVFGAVFFVMFLLIAVGAYLSYKHSELQKTEMLVWRSQTFGAPGTTETDVREKTEFMSNLRRVR